MEERFFRIEHITIENFKNVKYGALDLINRRKNYRASIVGLYGQNGSGKTALIDALQVLKFALCGKVVPEKYADYIHVEADHAVLKFQFTMQKGDVDYKIWYQFSLKKVIDDTHSNDESIVANLQYKAQIYDEVLSFAYTAKDEKIRKGILIDTGTSEVFAPKSKFNELLRDGAADITEWLVTKRLVQAQGRTFVFSREMINAFRKYCKKEKYMAVIEGLYTFGNRELFVIDTENSGLISMNALPLNLMLPLNVPAPIPEETIELVRKIITNMNIVLEAIVPGLTIDIVDLGPIVSQEGKIGRLIQLMSLKNNKAIPFQYESEGIKKIVSILQLLIVVYNHSSITVAIDEIDAGIFEYLLGEILNIISEKGKGQLIFTSHNLRPLETIDKGFIAFTTTNPENRYIRMTNVKENNNLRDFYFRDIVLGEQNEPVYNPTNNFEIALAFREAGEAFGS